MIYCKLLMIFVCCLTSVSVAMAQFIAPTLVPESLIRNAKNTEGSEQSKLLPRFPVPLSQSSLQVGDIVRNKYYVRIGVVTNLLQKAAVIQFNDDYKIYSYECSISYHNRLKPICASDIVRVYHGLHPADPEISFNTFEAKVLGVNGNEVLIYSQSDSGFLPGGVHVYDVDDIRPLNVGSHY